MRRSGANSDEALTPAAAGGDREARATLYRRRHCEPVYRYGPGAHLHVSGGLAAGLCHGRRVGRWQASDESCDAGSQRPRSGGDRAMGVHLAAPSEAPPVMPYAAFSLPYRRRVTARAQQRTLMSRSAANLREYVASGDTPPHGGASPAECANLRRAPPPLPRGSTS